MLLKSTESLHHFMNTRRPIRFDFTVYREFTDQSCFQVNENNLQTVYRQSVVRGPWDEAQSKWGPEPDGTDCAPPGDRLPVC